MKEKILFIHNQTERVYDIIEADLKKAGFTVVTARKSDEVKEKSLAEKPLMIVLDLAVIETPWDICQMLRDTQETRNIPIFVLAQRTGASDMVNAAKYSVEGYLARPYYSDVIIKFAENIIKKRGKAKTILLVEDDEDFLNIVETNLLYCGYNVITADGPMKALEIAKKQEIHLLITDVMMPELDGIGLYLEMKKIPGKEELPTIMITSRDKFEEMRYAYNIGVELYLTKPFDPLELLDKVGRIFRG